ncbi:MULTISPECIES: phospho-sugar mutase [unclassified Treponema]|uniref:phospho-sugar mutase n=1 Tax=unclassified Treponema TaxID=2638727 RepID=UPI0020A4718A|nr:MULTISPECIES: phospho-sugar mutase [unclassified Treponema]UTC67769.1 phospho-sugar mutase [Treponema sp. OMZ 789]UTC70494.1 phospho-sugar mutase [Treponema sp. OMZ 790]UTC73206.1 phospho-sugar mutase [Treponema sp. OMZ 791]
MDKNEVLNRAKKYISEEKEVKFADEVKSLIEKNDEKELYDRFYRDLEFGTAGLRGIIGGGTNRMNPFVIKNATQGLADYLIEAKADKAKAGSLSAVIAYDSRRFSDVFAKTAALIFAANNIRCYLFSSLRPTPELSYAIRELGCDTGIVVTASHNPPEYNGYKAYWSDGAQITPPHDSGIIKKVGEVSSIKMMSEDEALKKGKLVIIDKEIDEKYWAMLKNKISRQEIIKDMASKVKIVYTPLHGTGAVHVEKVLGEMGFNVISVPEQREPDGNFPTVSYPNPEDPKALKMAMDLAIKEGADILMATDPDADRFACAVKNAAGEMQLISGNQMGALFADYICLTLKEKNKLPQNAAIVRSIVTSPLSDLIAAKYNVKSEECLTGFKWICGVAERMVSTGSHTYLYGYEESFGYNFGTEIRDKDGIAASAICAEMTLYWRSKGKSLLDRLNEIFSEFAFYGEKTINMVYPGAEGLKIMQDMMVRVRERNLSEIAGVKVKTIRDIQESTEYSPLEPAKKTKVSLPKSNVLQYYLEDGSIICIRPSGTEPKIKIYIIHSEKVVSSVEEAKKQSDKKIAEFEKEFNGVLNA